MKNIIFLMSFLAVGNVAADYITTNRPQLQEFIKSYFNINNGQPDFDSCQRTASLVKKVQDELLAEMKKQKLAIEEAAVPMSVYDKKLHKKIFGKDFTPISDDRKEQLIRSSEKEFSDLYESLQGMFDDATDNNCKKADIFRKKFTETEVPNDFPISLDLVFIEATKDK